MSLPHEPGMVLFTDVTEALEAALTEGMPAVLAQIGGDDSLATPATFSRMARKPGDAPDTPWLVARTTGLAEPMAWDGMAFAASWDAVVTIAVRGNDWEDTKQRLAVYDTAARYVLATNPGLVSTQAPAGFSRSVSQITASYASTDDDRTYLEADVSCVVTVDDVIRLDGGPDMTSITTRVQLIHPALE